MWSQAPTPSSERITASSSSSVAVRSAISSGVGLAVLQRIAEGVPTDAHDRPTRTIKISACGEQPRVGDGFVERGVGPGVLRVQPRRLAPQPDAGEQARQASLRPLLASIFPPEDLEQPSCLRLDGHVRVVLFQRGPLEPPARVEGVVLLVITTVARRAPGRVEAVEPPSG